MGAVATLAWPIAGQSSTALQGAYIQRYTRRVVCRLLPCHSYPGPVHALGEGRQLLRGRSGSRPLWRKCHMRCNVVVVRPSRISLSGRRRGSHLGYALSFVGRATRGAGCLLTVPVQS